MRRTAAFAVLVAALLVLGGCLGSVGNETATPGDSDGDGEPSAEAIRSQAVETMETLETAEYEMRMNVSTDDRTVRMAVDGAIDRENRKQEMDVEVTVTDGERTRTRESKAYVDGTTMYQRTMGIWQSWPVAEEEVWGNGSQIGQSRAILDSVSVSRAGTATVNGRETHVLELAAEDVESFEAALKDRLSQDPGSDDFDGEIHSFEATTYVATDTDHVLRTEMVMDITTEDGTDATISTTITYSNIDGDVSIEIPAEARA